MPPANLGQGSFAKVRAAKDWSHFKGKIMGVLNPLHVLWTWRLALALLRAMQAEVAEEAGGNQSKHTTAGRRAGLQLQGYKKGLKEKAVKDSDTHTAMQNSRDGILKHEMGRQYTDFKAQNCAKEEDLAAKQESYYREWMIVVIAMLTHALREAFGLTEGSSNAVQDSVRKHLFTDELEGILQLDTPYQEEWTKEPWTHPLVKIWVGLLVRFQSAGEAISGTFMNDLKKLLISAEGRKQTFHELDHEYWLLLEPMLKAFDSTQTKAMVDHMRACYRYTVIQGLAEGDDVRAECWRRAHDELHRCQMAGEAITLEHTNRAVELAESHLRKIQETEQDTERKSQADQAQAAGLLARGGQESVPDNEAAKSALLSRHLRSGQKGEKRLQWCEPCQKKHPMPCRKAVSQDRTREETSPERRARERILDKLLTLTCDSSRPREQLAAHLALETYKANRGPSTVEKIDYSLEWTDDEDEAGAAAK